MQNLIEPLAPPMLAYAALLKQQLACVNVSLFVGRVALFQSDASCATSEIDWQALRQDAVLRRPSHQQIIIDLALTEPLDAALALGFAPTSPIEALDLRPIMAWVAAFKPWLALVLAQQTQLLQRFETENVLRMFDIGTFAFDLDKGVVELTASAAHVSGLKQIAQEIDGPGFLDTMKPEFRAEFLYSINRTATLGQRGQIVYQSIGGEWRSARFTLDPRTDDIKSANKRVVGFLQDYSQVRSMELDAEQHQAQLESLVKHLRAHSRTDPLTGLANRMELTERLSVAAIAAQSAGSKVSMLVIDIDYFKSYNDSFGHADGDKTLKAVADLIKAQAHQTDLVVRFGGEEFCVLSVEAQPEALAERIRNSVAKANWPRRAITVSVGVSCANAADFHADQLFKAADDALYEAKRSGRNRVCVSAAEAHR